MNQGGNKKPKKSKCMNFTPIDMFGSPVEFNINGDTQYKTVVGCLWTVVMVGLMIAATVYYIIQYLDKTNVTLTSQVIQQTTYPKMDFKSKGLYFTLMFQKGQNFLRPKEVESMFYVDANLFVYSSTSDSSTNERTFNSGGPTVSKLDFQPCRSAGITASVNGKAIKGKTSRALSDFGYCANIKNSQTLLYFEGDEDSDTYAYVELRIFPCDGTFPQILVAASGTGPSGPQGMTYPDPAMTNTACSLPNQKAGTYTLNPKDQQYLRQSLRDLSVTVSLIDTAVEATDYDSPLIYMINSNYKYALTSAIEKKVNFIFKTIDVATDKGILFENTLHDISYSIGEVIFDGKDRDANDRVQFFSPTGPSYQPIPYISFKFLAGNTLQEYTRSYTKLLDVLALVGGISQVFTSVIVILYAWYNGIRMEQELINRTILHIDPEDEKLEQWERDRALSFGDVFKFHYFSCCYKKKDKYKMYKKCEDQVAEKTDITKIIKAVSDIDVLKNSLLTPAQLRLMRYAALNEVDDDEKEAQQEMTTTEAANIIRNAPRGQNIIEDRINDYLLERIPKNLQSGGFISQDNSQLKVGKLNDPSVNKKYGHEVELNAKAISSPEKNQINKPLP